MNKTDYVNKMMDLLNDNNTYERMPNGYAEREAIKFKMEVRKILRKTETRQEITTSLRGSTVTTKHVWLAEDTQTRNTYEAHNIGYWKCSP